MFIILIFNAYKNDVNVEKRNVTNKKYFNDGNISKKNEIKKTLRTKKILDF